MNRLITINLSFYNQSDDILLKHINIWDEFPIEIKKLFCFYIMDDCSKRPASEIIKKEEYPDLDLHLYRVEKDLCCNISGVRNLGAKECNTPWIVILDMDTIISEELAKSMILLAKDNLNKREVFKFNRTVPDNPNHIKENKPHPAICLIRKDDYWNIGGCEEDLVGHYGYTDPSFWYRSKNKVTINILKDMYLLYYPEGESDINRNRNHNKKLFESKKQTGKWSTDFIRFNWSKVF